MSSQIYNIFNDVPFRTLKPNKHRKKFYAVYGVFCKMDGAIFGYTENSFSMGWRPDFVRGWSLKDAEYHLNKLKNGNKKVHYFIYRLTRRNGVIVADFKQRKNLIQQHGQKYYYRNTPFTIMTNKGEDMYANQF